MKPPDEKLGGNFRSQLRFPNGGTDEIKGGLRSSNMLLPQPRITVIHRPNIAQDYEDEYVGSD